MTTTVHRPPEPTHPPANGHGLRANAIGFVSNLAIGVASTAPAYSLAATLGLVVAVTGVGVHAPAVMLVSFVPMFCISVAYRALNRADPDCGTTFAWVTRAMGPWLGWLSGFAIFAADIIVMATLSEIAGKYFFRLVGWSGAAGSAPALATAAIVFIALMTWVSYRGVELSARLQQALLGTEVTLLVVFAVAALVKVYAHHPHGSLEPRLSWINPFALSTGALVDGVLLGVFVYWGWDACMSVNEESHDPRHGPGRAAVLSTVLLLVIFVLVSSASQAVAGPGFLSANSTDVLSVLGTRVFGSPWDKLLVFVVLTSTAASTQTTIMPTARTTLSMARWGALPAALGRIHPRFRTPSVSTLAMGAVSTVWTVALLLLNPAQSVLGDSIAALGFLVAFYYGLTGLACVLYYRRRITASLGAALEVGVLPGLGALLLAGIFVKAFAHYSQHEIGGQLVNYARPMAGMEVPIVIGIGSLVLGLVLMVACAPRFRDYFGRVPEALATENPDRPSGGTRPMIDPRSRWSHIGEKPDYAGLASFGVAPYSENARDLEGIDVAIMGAPTDDLVSDRPGTRNGPRAIRMASAQSGVHLHAGVDPLGDLRVLDFGDAPVLPADPVRSHAAIAQTAATILGAGAMPLVLGGDHSITEPVIRACAAAHGPVGLVHFDAHTDTAAECFGVALSHGTPMYRLVQSGHVDPARYVQIGLRGYWPPPEVFAWQARRGITAVTMHEVLERGLSAVLDGAIALLGSGPVYLTVDVDVLDPAFAPGTGTPEPGGMTSRELLSACRRVATDLALIGADVVEVSPMAFGTADITALVGARIAHEVLTGCALRRAASATAGPAGFVKPTPG